MYLDRILAYVTHPVDQDPPRLVALPVGRADGVGLAQ